MKHKALTLLCICLLVVGCSRAPGEPESSGAEGKPGQASTAQELEIFFETGEDERIELGADIELGETMLKLAAGRGAVTIEGNGYKLSGAAPSLIRLEEGCAITLNNITLQAEQIALGLLDGGTIGGQQCVISAQNNAIHAAGFVQIAQGASFDLYSESGAGIHCVGAQIGADATLSVEALTFGINTGRGDLAIQERANIVCVARGDNIVETDGTLTLLKGAVLSSTNSGDHNAARIGTLRADPDARLELQGGNNGIGLFVVEQYEDVELKGYCKPELRQERGEGTITLKE